MRKVLVAQPDDLSDIYIWMSMSIQIQVTEKYSDVLVRKVSSAVFSISESEGSKKCQFCE